MSSPIASTQELLVERQGGTVVLTLHRPDRRNALSRDLVQELGRVAKGISSDDTVTALVLTGSGGKAFCAGADLKEREKMSVEEVREFLEIFRVTNRYIEAIPVPTIAAIEGVALGGGLELALCCDWIVASADARMGLPEVTLGIIPGAGGTQRLVRAVGASLAKELIVFGRVIDATEALRIGLVHAVGSPSALDRAMSWAKHFEHAAPIAVRAALSAIDGGVGLSLEDGLDLERRCYEQTLASADRLEALAAFKEKRQPKFHGR